ncbi:unnamed protein product [Amoebophrya sp. A25]|nr:unnamed protein product [Amoebophrya sp. A25]|eukprot:GSA25T00000478001.1
MTTTVMKQGTSVRSTGTSSSRGHVNKQMKQGNSRNNWVVDLLRSQVAEDFHVALTTRILFVYNMIVSVQQLVVILGPASSMGVVSARTGGFSFSSVPYGITAALLWRVSQHRVRLAASDEDEE